MDGGVILTCEVTADLLTAVAALAQQKLGQAILIKGLGGRDQLVNDRSQQRFHLVSASAQQPQESGLGDDRGQRSSQRSAAVQPLGSGHQRQKGCPALLVLLRAHAVVKVLQAQAPVGRTCGAVRPEASQFGQGARGQLRQGFPQAIDDGRDAPACLGDSGFFR